MKRLPPRSTRPDPLVPYATLSDLEIVAEGKAGSRRLLAILDDSPRYLNTALLLRLLCEVSAIVLVARLVSENLDGWWLTVGLSIGIMLLVRSEEHTSELQSLMRIPSAVFCLKNKQPY